MAHERQALAIRRPGQRVDCSLIDEQWLSVASAARSHGQNSFLVDKQQPAAIGREARGASRADLVRRAAGRGNHPYFLRIAPAGELLTLAGISSSRLWPR